MSLEIVPVTLAEARRFVAEHHRHNEPPRGHKFSIGLSNGELRGLRWSDISTSGANLLSADMIEEVVG